MSELIDISRITVNPGRRKLIENDVRELADSIKNTTLLHPITVVRNNGHFDLIAGLHRLEAYKRLGRTEIPATVTELEGKQKELAEIDENLIRGKLRYIDRAEQLKRRKEIYEELYPGSKAGTLRAAGMNKKLGNNVNESVSPTFTENASKQSGLSQRTIQQDIHLAETLTPEVKDAVRDFDIPKADALKLASMVGEKQNAIIQKIRDGKAKDITEANRALVAEAKSYYGEAADVLPADCKLICAGVTSLSEHVEAESIDVIITEPPCMKESLDLYETLAIEAAKVLKDGGSMFVTIGQSHLPEVLSLVAKRLTYHWTLAYLVTDGHVVDSKNIEALWKPVLWFVKNKYVGDGANSGDVCVQSESGVSELIEKFTYPGQTILDPFVGSSETTALKAMKMGRKFIGIDQDLGAIENIQNSLRP